MTPEIKKDIPKLFKVTIDNITVEVEPGTSILQAARNIGGDVAPPAMCYYSTLKGSGGKCRTCLVEVAQGSTADTRPMPKLVASCRTNVMDGMVVKNITSEKVLEARKGVVEFLLLNHPLDCPICDQARSEEHTSELQSLAYLVCRLLLEKKKYKISFFFLLHVNDQLHILHSGELLPTVLHLLLLSHLMQKVRPSLYVDEQLNCVVDTVAG